jgi:hypothetical protein
MFHDCYQMSSRFGNLRLFTFKIYCKNMIEDFMF